MKLIVRYERPEDLVAEHDEQMVKGGLLVRGEPPPGLALFQPVELEIAGDFLDGPVVVPGQVVQVFGGVGVAVAFDAAAVSAAVAAAKRPARPEAQTATKTDTAAKIHAALYGTKDDRLRALRDTNRMLHPYVLRNPGLGLDEVLAMAKMTTLSPDVYAQIAQRREWAERPDIAIALVRNPKTPTPLAVRLLDFVSPADLRQLAKDSKTRPAVQQAARKKVIG
jgi:hypothetical protein